MGHRPKNSLDWSVWLFLARALLQDFHGSSPKKQPRLVRLVVFSPGSPSGLSLVIAKKQPRLVHLVDFYSGHSAGHTQLPNSRQTIRGCFVARVMDHTRRSSRLPIFLLAGGQSPAVRGAIGFGGRTRAHGSTAIRFLRFRFLRSHFDSRFDSSDSFRRRFGSSKTTFPIPDSIRNIPEGLDEHALCLFKLCVLNERVVCYSHMSKSPKNITRSASILKLGVLAEFAGFRCIVQENGQHVLVLILGDSGFAERPAESRQCVASNIARGFFA